MIAEAVRQGVTLAYTPTTLKDAFYIVQRRLRRTYAVAGGSDASISFVPAAWACVECMTEIATAVRQALPECPMAWARGEHADLEDNLAFAAAETCGADYVVTYDRELLEHLGSACITPACALTALRVWSAKP